MEKVIVIGSPGAGKSTFARSLSMITGLPLFYLDMLYHKPDRTTRTREEFDASLGVILQLDRWIIDGNYGRTMKRRMDVCDTVFFLDYPLDVCLDGVRSRFGVKRPDMPWVEEEEDREFMQFTRDFPISQRPGIIELLTRYEKEKKIVTFKSREEAERYLVSQAVPELDMLGLQR